ncbi:MAG: beta-N-acetylhexosaminidase [Deltaproteobacteria bacterium]|nr:beta-N-acetylhexosaminidase [Deltaproteobacteria bacterium]
MTSNLERLAGQVLVVGLEGPEAPPTLLGQVHNDLVAGVILFRRNVREPRQLVRLVRAIREAGQRVCPIVSIDQEGGPVLRMTEPWTVWPEAMAIAERGDRDLARAMGQAMGEEMAPCGITCDFAPVLDVHTNPNNPIIGRRAFGTEPGQAATLAIAWAEGLMSQGIAACGKHFPGHGDTDRDSHKALPVVAHPTERLETIELEPFRRAAATLPAMMSAHVVYPAWDRDHPATLSKAIIADKLRTVCGFKGVLVSDDLEMAAVADLGSIEEIAVQAIAAGVDLLLVCQHPEKGLADRARTALVNACRNDWFRSRLQDAAGRVQRLRRAFRGRTPDEDDAIAVAGSPAHLAILGQVRSGR